MRIPCPFCGPRDINEFAYSGDATLTRPADGEDMHDYVYLRDNLSGVHKESWYHASGCHAWLTVTRNVSNHEILEATLAHEATP